MQSEWIQEVSLDFGQAAMFEWIYVVWESAWQDTKIWFQKKRGEVNLLWFT